MTDPIHAQLTDALARELYRRLYPGPIGTHDHYRTPESDLAENDRAYEAWDEGRQGYAPRLICTETAEHVANVLLALPNIAVVELPADDAKALEHFEFGDGGVRQYDPNGFGAYRWFSFDEIRTLAPALLAMLAAADAAEADHE